MRRLMAVFVALALLAPGANAAPPPGRLVTLAVPRGPSANNELVLRVRAGVLRRGMEIDVYDAGGKLLGTVSPFAIRGHREAGTYTIPAGADAPRRNRMTVRLVLTEFGEPPRAPTRQEVRSVTARFVDVTN